MRLVSGALVVLVAHTCAALEPGPALLLRVSTGVHQPQVGVTRSGLE